MCDGEAVGGIVEVCNVDGCRTVGVCATEGRAVDELFSALEKNGASVILVTYSLVPLHVMKWTVLDKTSADLLAPRNHLEQTQTHHLKKKSSSLDDTSTGSSKSSSTGEDCPTRSTKFRFGSSCTTC